MQAVSSFSQQLPADNNAAEGRLTGWPTAASIFSTSFVPPSSTAAAPAVSHTVPKQEEPSQVIPRIDSTAAGAAAFSEIDVNTNGVANAEEHTRAHHEENAEQQCGDSSFRGCVRVSNALFKREDVQCVVLEKHDLIIWMWNKSHNGTATKLRVPFTNKHAALQALVRTQQQM